MSKQFRKPGQWKAYLWLTYSSLRAQTRNPATFFFGFIFPIVFISIFGVIGGGTPKVTIGIPSNIDQNNPIVQVLKNSQAISRSIRQMKQALKKSSNKVKSAELSKSHRELIPPM